jgi:hypothetical protein
VPFNLSDPDGYFDFIADLRWLDQEIGGLGDGPRALTIGLWLPSARGHSVGEEIAQLDLDARRIAAWRAQPMSRHLRRRGLPFVEELYSRGLVDSPFLFPQLFEPITPSEGGLEVTQAISGSSLDIDFNAVGLVVGLLAS